MQQNWYACRECWFKLPVGIRNRIQATYRINPDEHYEAMVAAAAWYAENTPPRIGPLPTPRSRPS